MSVQYYSLIASSTWLPLTDAKIRKKWALGITFRRMPDSRASESECWPERQERKRHGPTKRFRCSALCVGKKQRIPEFTPSMTCTCSGYLNSSVTFRADYSLASSCMGRNPRMRRPDLAGIWSGITWFSGILHASFVWVMRSISLVLLQLFSLYHDDS